MMLSGSAPLRRAGLSNYYFIWLSCQVQLRNRPQFLLQFKSDPGAMYDLRRALSEYYPRRFGFHCC